MLVGCGMENIFRSEVFEYGLHPRGVDNAGHDSGSLYRRELPRHHKTDVMLRGLSRIDEHHF